MGRFPIPEGFRYDKYMKKVLRIKEIDDPDGEHIIRVDYFNDETCSYTHEEFVLPRVQWGSFEEPVEQPEKKPIESKRTKWLKVGAATLGMLGFLLTGGIMLSQLLDGQGDAKPTPEVSGSAQFTDPLEQRQTNAKAPPKTYSPVAVTKTGVLILKYDGMLYGLGKETDRAFLGLSKDPDNLFETPTVIHNGIQSVKAYGNNVLVLDKFGELKIWGEKQPGTETRYVHEGKKDPLAYSMGEYSLLMVDNESNLIGYGRSEEEDVVKVRVPLTNEADVKYAVLGGDMGYGESLFVIKNDDTLWALGGNSQGEVGNGSTIKTEKLNKIMEDVAYVHSKEGTSCAITKDGTLYWWGQLDEVKTGEASSKKVEAHTPTKLEEDVVFAVCETRTVFYIKKDGSLWAVGKYVGFENDPKSPDGYRFISSNEPIQLLDRCIYVATGDDRVVAVQDNGSVLGLGYKGYFGKDTVGNEKAYTKFELITTQAMMPKGSDYPGVLWDDYEPNETYFD